MPLSLISTLSLSLGTPGNLRARRTCLLPLSRRLWAKTSCSHLGGRPSCKSSGQQRHHEGPQKYGRRSLVRGGPSCLLLLLLWLLCFVLLLFVRSSLVRVFVIAWLVGCSSK